MESLNQLFILSDYLSQLYRRLWTSHANAETAAVDLPSLECLPDDVVLVVLDHLEQLDAKNALQTGFLTHELSDVVQFSTVCKRIRGLAEPRIFRTLHLGPSWSAKKLSSAFKIIRSSEGSKRCTRVLKVDLWLEGVNDVSNDHQQLMSELLGTISNLEQLRALGITATESSALALQLVLEDIDPIFHGITGLVLSPHMDWLIPRCPNLQTLSTNDWVVMSRDKETHTSRLIDAVSGSTDLQHFALHSPWRNETLNEVLLALPSIRSLGMLSGNCTSNLDDRLLILRKFQHLETLEMTDASKFLKVQAWQDPEMPRSHCGIYKEKNTAAQAHVTQKVFQALPQLKELILGPAFRAWVVRRHADGRIDLKWEATFVRPSLFERRPSAYDHQWEKTCTIAQADELAEQLSIADTMDSRADAQTLADVLHHDNDEGGAEQLRLLQKEMAM